MTSLRIQLLGPLRVWRHGVELDIGPHQQAHLLALLLAHGNQPIGPSELIDLIWANEDVPATALNIVQKYVGALRRLLEPQIPARRTGSYVQRRGTGYLFVAGPGVTVDVAVFRGLVAQAESHLAHKREEEALDCYERALPLWTGPAGSGLSDAAVASLAALNDEYFTACISATTLAVSLGRPARVLPALRLAVSMKPLHEGLQAALVSALGAAGRPEEALSAFHAVRAQLADELGIDPGSALRDANERVLSQMSGTAGALVGRSEELALLRQTVDSAVAGGTGLVVVEGEPGVGKTRLLEEIAAEAEQAGTRVVWGRCLDGDGTPSMWPWVQAVGAILEVVPTGTRDELFAGELGRLVTPTGGDRVPPDNGTRFRLFEGVVSAVAQISANGPLMFIIDDLQWADIASLHLFRHLVARLVPRTAIIVALRNRAPEPGSELLRALAEASRAPGHRRLRLGPLGLAAVAELVRRESGRNPSPAMTRRIHGRTSGNPFFVRELSRTLAGGNGHAEEAADRPTVPSTVRDVVRDRVAALDEDTTELLRAAALIGRDVDLGLLAASAVLDVATCLDRLEPLNRLGLIESTPGDPFSFRFAHDLVRESVVETTPPQRAPRLHLRIADALERRDDDEVAERLAYHLWAAGPLADPGRTTGAMVRAGRCAAAKTALEAAQRHFESAVRAAHSADLPALELSALEQLTVVVGMRSMYGASAIGPLERAESLARDLGREREAAGFLYSRWAAHVQGLELDRSGVLARRLFTRGEASSDSVVRTYGLYAWGLQQWDAGNVGEAFRLLTEGRRIMLDDLARRADDPVRHDLQLLMTGMEAEVTALHGDVDAARALLGTLRATDPYSVTVLATIEARIAVLVGDSGWALRAADRGAAVDPGFSFVFLGTYQRLARYWARALTGDDPGGAAAAAERLIETNLFDPPRSCVATWYGLLGEMLLAAGSTVEAGAALDRADRCLEAYGQRYPEGLLLLLRARLLHARGEPPAVVRAAAERARALSTERGAHLFAQRSELLLAQLDRSEATRDEEVSAPERRPGPPAR
jgi:DNA-binding SARP family transcriptional activator